MSTKTYIRLWLAALSLLATSASLYSIRQMLPDITVKAGVVLLALLAGYLLYLGHKFYVRFKLHHLELQAKEQELSAAEQNKRIEAERWQVERAALLLNQQIQAGRIYPDPKGYMPMVVSITEAGHQYIQLPHPAHMGRSYQQSQQPALPEHAESRQGELMQALPASVRYEDIAAQIPAGHSCLGISERGLETCEFKDLMTMLISGGSSTGKSNTVAIKLREAMQIGRNTRMIVIDPHKTKPDSLYNKIRQYESRFLMPVAQKDDEIVQALTWFKREFQRRLELSTQELEELDDILLVCDEVFALVFHREDERIAKLIKLVSGIAGYESRGYGMYAWFLTQKVSGLKWLRDAVMTTICHKMQNMAERKLAANDDATIARDMDNWTMKGRVVVFGLNLPVTVSQMPHMTVVESDLVEGDDEMEELQPRSAFRPDAKKRNDEAAGVSGNETHEQAARVLSNIIVFPVSGNTAPTSEEKTASGVSDETKKIILRMHNNNIPLRDIAKFVGLAGEKYNTFKRACQELNITPGQAANE